MHGKIICFLAMADDCPEGLVVIASHGGFFARSGEHLFGVSLSDGSVRWSLAVGVPYLTPPSPGSPHLRMGDKSGRGWQQDHARSRPGVSDS